ncbi:AsmA-like C-terminal region-containing protein, partial [Candidatus Pelagibacter bacterium]|nr:AsmA-like C-terminal region-containing protein [Candidatus Pelagibacter bacterium]
ELKITGDYINDNNLNFKKISILDQDNKIILKNLLLNKNNKIITIDELDLNYFDTENKKNQFLILRKKKNDYQINGLTYNANKLINNLLKSKSKNDSKIFTNNINLNLNLREVYIDEANLINNLKGHLKIKNNKVHDSNILANFNNEKILTISIKTDNNERVTTLYSSNAKPFVKRYKFIKGFDGGDLNFYSTKKDNISDSVLKIDNFKVQEVPALAKLLSLASLQGVADLLTGEGIRFTDFEMNFSNNNDLMTINELYAIGPSISVLMDGYIQSDDLISLRGTLVPATTINRTIATIPLVGNLLIGKKVGEGVFGVSFKIKGPPKDLKTTVNPVKTLTPRFITRILEKIKKN